MHLVPNSEGDSTALVQQFFACLAALMSTQLRSLVINSLADFVSFLSLYKVNNIKLKIQISCRLIVIIIARDENMKYVHVTAGLRNLKSFFETNKQHKKQKQQHTCRVCMTPAIQ